MEADTPVAWPIVWTFLAILLLPAAWRRRSDPEGGLALALLVSAATLEASFLVISIASDIRYHLWSMAASALSLILLADGLRMKRGAFVLSGATLALVIAAGLVARASFPRAPDTYQGMIHSASG
jgi:4-amino-4-deoxy-L-arabinose transferase-like glycosyltransferase